MLSEFNENNAQASKNEVIKCIGSILEYYNMYVQEYGLYLPLMSTGLSRMGLLHDEDFQTIDAILQLFNQKYMEKWILCLVIIANQSFQFLDNTVT